MADQSFQRLPTSVTPTNYVLRLTPDLKSFTFSGHEEVEVTINQATSEIVLNAKELEIQKALLRTKEGKEIKVKDVSIDDKREIATIKFDETLTPGAATLILDFTGILNDKMKGFYRSKVISADGKESWAATTQFESTDARRAFPCWDEPALKASFDITLVAPKDMEVLSNMLPENEVPDSSNPGLKVVKFQRTPIMSTYLVAFIVGDFEYIEGKSGDGVRVRVYAPKGKAKFGDYALKITERALPFYKEYFQIAYPLTKMDLVAVPDFAAGAMENWGLVTYRAISVLWDPENSSTHWKQYIALTVSHEIAHQWFGNLVTMEWWTDLWLNEGFASFIEHLCTDALCPEMNIWMPFVTDLYTEALDLDSLENTHPIEVPVNDPAEIDEIFDNISYSKGASVIRMLYHFLGEEGFKNGMRHYLKRHAYKNTKTQDLWDALQEVSGKPVSKVMPTWTNQKGYPLLNVEESHSGTLTTLKLTQQIFCPAKLLGLKKLSSDDNSQWLIPITASAKSKPNKVAAETLMDGQSTTLTIDGVSDNDWIKINPGAVGFYRVNYPPKMLAKFESSIRDKSLPPIDRFHLHNDLYAMVAAGRTSTADLLKFMLSYKEEDNYTVWASISDCVRKILFLLSNTESDADILNAYGQDLFTKIYEKLGWEARSTDSHLDLMLRTVVINRLINLKDKRVIDEANVRFRNHLEKGQLIAPDLRGAAYRAVGLNCSQEVFDRFFEMYRTTNEDEEKLRIAQGLSATTDPSRAQKVLDFALSSDVRSQDAGRFITLVALGSFKNRLLAWDFFVKKKDELLRRYESGNLMNNIIKGITTDFASFKLADQVEKYFSDNTYPGTERTVQQCVEEIRLNAAWLERDLPAIKNFLASLPKSNM